MFAHAVSIPGNGHIRRELPCQDASGVWLSPRPCLIVCDGRGSASLSHLGARAAVRAFRSQCAVMEARLSCILDQPRCGSKDWHRFCQMMIRTVCQQKTELAEEHNCSEREFDFTIAFAIFGKHHIGVFQVGDGAITIQRNGQCSITSDGPEHLMFDLQTMTPGPIFDQLFTDLSAGQLTRQDILDYLTGTRWTRDPRGADDRSLAILAFPSHEEEAPDGLV